MSGKREYRWLSIADRLEARSIPITETGCRIWLGHLDSWGYGEMGARGRYEKAHRLAWELVNGAIPTGMFVCHRCDTPQCINPDHLFLGTPIENTRDMIEKGRGRAGSWFAERTHCPQGHEYSAENTYHRKDGRPGRQCRACGNARSKRKWHERHTSALATADKELREAIKAEEALAECIESQLTPEV